MSNNLQVFSDKSFAGKWRNRLPEAVKMKFAIEAEHAKGIMLANPKGFDKCPEESVQQALMSAAMIGLSLSPQLQHLYLIPRWNKNLRITEATLLVSYKGMMEVVNRDGNILWVKAKVRYSNEPFEYIEGTTTEIRHKIIPDADKRGVKTGAYCVAKTRDGDLLVEYMDAEQIGRVRAKSESKDSDYSPWNNFEEEMWKKSVVRRAWKMWPKSSGLDGIVEVMNKYESIKFNETVGRENASEAVMMISEEQTNELYSLVSDALPNADAGKWLKRLAGSMGEEKIEDLPVNRFDEAKESLGSAIHTQRNKE
jgi:phage RecT family recombinase